MTGAVGQNGPGDGPVTADPLGDYRRSMRRGGRIYVAVVGVVVLALLVVVLVAWSRGEAAHVTLHTTTAPPTLAAQSPGRTVTEAWHSTDQVALGTPQYGGTVITYSAHTVGGRDARTGKPTWSYTRSDRTVCTAAQLNGTTIAVFELHGNCDELTALDSGTGQRRWTRTLDMDGMPIDGHPDFQTTPYTLMVTQSDVIYAIDPSSGYDRWDYYRPGCTIEHAQLGNSGVLISQDCTPDVQCGQLKYCGPGQQLMLRDPNAGNGDSDSPNADQIKWIQLGNADLPVSADTVVSTLSPDRRSVSVLDPNSGKTLREVSLGTPVSAGVTIRALPTTTAELLWLGDRLRLLPADPTVGSWTATVPNPPSVATPGIEDPPQLSAARICFVAGDGRVTELDPLAGRVLHTVALAAPAGSQVWPLGAGYLVAGTSGVAAYS